MRRGDQGELMTYPPPGYDPRAQAKADKAYRKAMRPWYQKKRFLVPLVLLALVFVSSVLGSGAETDRPTATVAPSGGGPAAPAPVQADDAPPAFPGATADDVVAQAGQAITTDTGVTMTAGALKSTRSEFGGKPLLCTDVAYQNGSDETTSFNGGFDWKVQDPNGAILMNTFSGNENALNSGELAPGGKTSGQVCFESASASPKGTYVVLLDPSFRFGSERVAWINKL
jgi:uncharacterized protein DUF4352